jgi:hypothetical protein
MTRIFTEVQDIPTIVIPEACRELIEGNLFKRQPLT